MTLQRALATQTASENYASAVIGKWHIAGSNPDLNHPNDSGVPFNQGNITGTLSDYYNWPVVTNGVESVSNVYYHYHGHPHALFDDSSVSTVVGFAADGFPIFSSYFDDNGTVRDAQPSFQLKAGARPTGDGQPGGNYDGTYRDDYEYVAGSDDLHECNGMTLNGIYGYYVTDAFPYILSCFKGTADESFLKRAN